MSEDGDYGEWEEYAGTERLLQASQVYDEKESMDVYLSIILQAKAHQRIHGRSELPYEVVTHKHSRHPDDVHERSELPYEVVTHKHSRHPDDVQDRSELPYEVVTHKHSRHPDDVQDRSELPYEVVISVRGE
jgi:hypothetical protein